MRNVISQLPAPIEHIVVDGNSTDGTKEILARYGELFEHIRWISEPDSGQSEAMNKGIALAKGRLIAFLNVDDRFTAKALQKVIELTEGCREPLFLVGQLLSSINNDTPTISLQARARNQMQVLMPRWFRFPANPASYFYSKTIHEMVGGYREDEHYLMDYEFLIRASGVVDFTYTHFVLGEFRLSDNCKTRTDSKHNLKRKRDIQNAYLRKQSVWFRLQYMFYEHYLKQINYWRREIIRFSFLVNSIARSLPSRTHKSSKY